MSIKIAGAQGHCRVTVFLCDPPNRWFGDVLVDYDRPAHPQAFFAAGGDRFGSDSPCERLRERPCGGSRPAGTRPLLLYRDLFINLFDVYALPTAIGVKAQVD